MEGERRTSNLGKFIEQNFAEKRNIEFANLYNQNMYVVLFNINHLKDTISEPPAKKTEESQNIEGKYQVYVLISF